MNWFSVTCREHLVSSLSWVSLMGLLLPTLLKASEDKLLFGSDLRKPLEPTDSPAHCGQSWGAPSESDCPPTQGSEQPKAHAKWVTCGHLSGLPRAGLRTRKRFRILLPI